MKSLMKPLEISNITLKMIIDKGFLAPNTELVAIKDAKITGLLLEDGSINVNFKTGVVNYPFPSGAARGVEKMSLNGWIYWGAFTAGQLKPLSFFREMAYLSMKKS